MEIFKSFILGIIEGITEFLPISSTAHLIIASKILNITQNEFHKFFEVFIQGGAILAVLLLYFKKIKEDKETIKKIIISFLPTAFFGFLFYKIIKNIFFETEILIVLSLFIIGLLFIFIEKSIKKGIVKLEKNLNELNYLEAFLIGLIQSLSIIPGISRAGAVILIMLILKFKRKEAVLYSFYLAVPTIISASLYDLYKITNDSNFQIINYQIINLLIGFLTSFIFAIISTKWLINYLQKNDLEIFGWYRIILSILILLFLL